MSGNAKLGGTLPAQNELNGLDGLAGKAVQTPDGMWVAVVVLDVKKLTTEIDSGDVVPTFRIRRIEPIPDGDDKKKLGQIARRAHERRTGKAVLPLELEDELREAFGDEA